MTEDEARAIVAVDESFHEEIGVQLGRDKSWSWTRVVESANALLALIDRHSSSGRTSKRKRSRSRTT